MIQQPPLNITFLTVIKKVALDNFDEWQYLADYGDLITTFGSDITAATQHYISNGYKEGRSLDNFDEWQYLASHEDLITTFGSDITAATQHYVSNGYAEGRSLDNFDEWGYLASNNDLLTLVVIRQKQFNI